MKQMINFTEVELIEFLCNIISKLYFFLNSLKNSVLNHNFLFSYCISSKVQSSACSFNSLPSLFFSLCKTFASFAENSARFAVKCSLISHLLSQIFLSKTFASSAKTQSSLRLSASCSQSLLLHTRQAKTIKKYIYFRLFQFGFAIGK